MTFLNLEQSLFARSSGPGVVLLLCALAIPSAGCESNASGRIDVSGQVTYASQPVPKGRIDFIPDATQGGVGPAGYATIVDGRFNTRSAGRGPVKGPHLVRIAGYSDDAPAIDEITHGKPLFDTYETTYHFDAGRKDLNFEIPAKGSR